MEHMRGVERIGIGEIFYLPETKAYPPPRTDTRNRTGWHAFLIKFLKRFKLLEPWQKRDRLHPY